MKTAIDPKYMVEKYARQSIASKNRHIIDEVHLDCLEKDAWIVVDDYGNDLFVAYYGWDFGKFPKEIEDADLRCKVIEEALGKMKFPDKERRGKLLEVGLIEMLANVSMEESKMIVKVKTTQGVMD